MDVGQVVNGKYKLLRLVGDGGMGSVFEAEHLMLGTHVAIKVLHGEMARRPGLVDRFLQEARVSAQIKSPHVVQVTDVDRTPEGVAYLVMELLQGEPMSALLDRDKKVAEPLACEYTLQILHALEAAHALGVIHRDLKPENVFITYAAGKPVLKLIDFGIAKLRRSEVGAKNLTVAGVMMGTAEYMAPEQAYSAGEVDARADIYSVGVMLYELLAGHRPVGGEDARVIALKVQRGEVKPLVHAAPGVTPEIAGLVHRAMAPSPDVRFASAAEMRLALEGALSRKASPAAAGGDAQKPGGGTVRLPAGGRAASERPPEPAMQPAAAGAAMAYAATSSERPPDPAAPKTGTMMGAPLDVGALAAKGSTTRAAPVDLPPEAYAAAPYGPGPSPGPGPVYAPPPAPEGGRRRSGGGIPKWMLILPALAGGLVGIALVVWYVQTQPSGPRPVPPVVTSATTTATTTSTGATTGTDTSTPIPTTAPLTTGTAQPTTTTTSTATAPRPSASGSAHPPVTPPSASGSAGPTPFVFPSTMPPIPSTLPSSFPLPAMSGFPFPLPGQPPQ